MCQKSQPKKIKVKLVLAFNAASLYDRIVFGWTQFSPRRRGRQELFVIVTSFLWLLTCSIVIVMFLQLWVTICDCKIPILLKLWSLGRGSRAVLFDNIGCFQICHLCGMSRAFNDFHNDFNNDDDDDEDDDNCGIGTEVELSRLPCWRDAIRAKVASCSMMVMMMMVMMMMMI